MHDAFALPGFRRHFLIEPSPGLVRAALEDDYHCMRVAFTHADGIVQTVAPVMERAPWTTCPGAVAQLRASFEGATLSEAVRLGGKKRNCTHLYDLAALCAVHADDAAATLYEIAVSDPIEGRSIAALQCNGVLALRWELERDTLCAPAELAGKALFAMRDWIGEIAAPLHEAARLLQWAAIIAHGRSLPMDRQNDASRMPANCYTFQPENAKKAVRVGEILDFSQGRIEPLDHYRGGVFSGRGDQIGGELP